MSFTCVSCVTCMYPHVIFSSSSTFYIPIAHTSQVSFFFYHYHLYHHRHNHFHVIVINISGDQRLIQEMNSIGMVYAYVLITLGKPQDKYYVSVSIFCVKYPRGNNLLVIVCKFEHLLLLLLCFLILFSSFYFCFIHLLLFVVICCCYLLFVFFFLRIQSEYRKILTRNNSVFGLFSRSE